MEKQTKAKPDVMKGGKSTNRIGLLRELAAEKLAEKMLQGELSAAELLKIMALTDAAQASDIPLAGDWVLKVQGDE
jgi:hypothetical protein